MPEWDMTATGILANAGRLFEAYYMALAPLCRELGLPPTAVDILLFVANNPNANTAKDICRSRGLKPGIVSIHVGRLVGEGLLERRSVPGDRRKTSLVCTPRAKPAVERGWALQRAFGQRLMAGVSEEELEGFRACIATFSRNIDHIREQGI